MEIAPLPELEVEYHRGKPRGFKGLKQEMREHPWLTKAQARRIVSDHKKFSGNFVRERKYAPPACAKGSFRSKKTKTGKLLTFCCPRGKWMPRKQRCKVALKLQSIGRLKK